MDVFDEFEMKPLTEGLGFHRKKEQTSDILDDDIQIGAHINKETIHPAAPSQRKSIDRATDALDKLMDSLNTLDKQGITFTDSLPSQKPPQPSNSIGTASQPNNTYNTLNQLNIHPEVRTPTPSSPQIPYSTPENMEQVKESIDEALLRGGLSTDAGTRRGSSDSLVGNLKELSVSLPSAILDTIVVFALSLLFLMGMLVATETSIDALVYSLTADLMTQVSAGMLFIVVLQIYTVVARCLFGCTLGEWTFDCQMGRDEQRTQGYYPLQNIWRSLLMIGTGLVVIPFLSLIARRDLARYLTGIQLYRKAY